MSTSIMESIVCPAPPPAAPAPLFSFPYLYSASTPAPAIATSYNGGEAKDDRVAPAPETETPWPFQKALSGSLSAVEREEDDVAADASGLHGQQPERVAANGLQVSQDLLLRHSQLSHHSSQQPKPALSTSPSVDGYDSFENTKNKKKRKIPTPGHAGHHHSHLSADLANLGISSAHAPEQASPDDLAAGTVQYYGSGYSASSVAGSVTSSAGSKGRVPRSSQWRTLNARSPLGVSTDGSNACGTGRAGKGRPREWNASGATVTGMPSSDPLVERFKALASTHGALKGDHVTARASGSATVEGVKFPFDVHVEVTTAGLPPHAPRPQPQPPASRKSIPTKTQFTFTAPSLVRWPASYAMGLSGSFHVATPQGTQTSPNVAGNRRPGQPPLATHVPPGALPAHHDAPLHGPHGPLHAGPAAPAQTQAQPSQQPGKKTRPRRTATKEYALAARSRRLQQEYNNYHHPPSHDEIWICEFCEYESIFGTPPEALIRQYEIKDRHERRRLEEKRRLLEKAKLKGRKGKKGGNKSGAKGGAAAAAAATPAPQDHAHAQQLGEEYLPDEFFDDDEDVTLAGGADTVPPMAAMAHHHHHHHHHDHHHHPPHPPPVPLTAQDTNKLVAPQPSAAPTKAHTVKAK
ncbi:MAG: hypothetical protein M1826_000524 [Phylliscum demangeonii]|nr:MAG: hypothetical protein M1826_000524 [Phylliscum demangeonii]